MRIVRYQIGEEAPRYGWLHEDKIGEIEGDLFGKYRRKEAKTPLTQVKLLAPSVPTKIVCVGRNYVEHAKELGNDVPKIPLIFMKPPSSIINPGDTIILPPQSKQVEHEAELVAVIGKRAHSVTAEEAKKYISRGSPSRLSGASTAQPSTISFSLLPCAAERVLARFFSRSVAV